MVCCYSSHRKLIQPWLEGICWCFLHCHLSLGGPSAESHVSLATSVASRLLKALRGSLSYVRASTSSMGKYLIYVVSKQTVSASVPLSEQTWGVRGVQGSPGSRERQETAQWQAHIISSILLSGFPRGLFTKPPGHCCCCCWSPTYFVSCQDPRGCGQQTTSWRGVGCSGAVLQHATVSGWKELLPPRHITQDVLGPYLVCRR